MPIANNPDTGEVLFLDGDQWKPAERAINPKTREMMAFDGKDWVHVDNAAAATVAGQMSGTRPVAQTTFGRAAENFPSSAGNLIAGAAETAVGAGKALINPDPRAKIEFIKNLAVGTYEGLKTRYGSGLTKAFENDPASVIADVLSIAGGIRGGAGLRSAETARATSGGLTRSGTAAVDKLNKAGADLSAPVPLDTGGEAVMGQVERLSNTSVAGREIMEPALTARQEGSLGAISNDLKGLVGTSRTARQAIEQTMESRKVAADPLYKNAYAAGDREIWSDEMSRLTGAPEVQEAMRGAVTGWQRSQIAQGYGALGPRQLTERGGILKIPSGRVPAFPNIQFWDYTKRNLDGMIESEIKPDGSLTTKGRELSTIKNKLVVELDKQVPEFKAARDSWSGHSSYLNAVNMGRDIFRQSSEDFTAEFNGLSSVDKQGAREAIVSTIIAKLERNPAKLADLTRDLRSVDMRKKLAAIMPNQAARDAWTKRLNFEVRSSELVGAGLKNSATARRLAQAADAEDLVLGTIKASLEATKPSNWLKLALTGAKKTLDKLHADRDREMAKLLTGQRPSRRAPTTAPTLGGSALTPFAPAAIDIGGTQEQ